MKNAQNYVYLYDTSLRDGGQTKGVNYTVEDKQAVAKVLDKLGVDYIEGGWPAANPVDTSFFNNLPILTKAKFASFGMTRKTGVKPEEDVLLNQVVNCGTQTVCLFGKSWDRHATEALGVSLPENLKLIESSVRHAKKMGREVVFDAEHFFDGYKNNPTYAVKCLKAAHKAGADWLVLCDTNGGTLSHQVDKIVRAVRKELPTAKLGIHAHNDSEVSVANSLIAVLAGCRMVQGTLLGIGERCGNANLVSVFAALKYKMGFDVGITDDGAQELTKVAKWFSGLVKKILPENTPYLGQAAFAHKGGVHVSAVEKNPDLYEHLPPELFGNKRDKLVSDQAGLSNLRASLEKLGVEYGHVNGGLQRLLASVKRREEKGYTFDTAPESFAVLAVTKLDESFEPFTMMAHKVKIVGEHVGDNGDHDLCDAKVKIKCKNSFLFAKATKNGPVDALDLAVRGGLMRLYPELEHLELIDYKLDLVDKNSATGAKTRVHITSRDKQTGQVMQTMGVSTNVVRASLEALVDSYKCAILTHAGALKSEFEPREIIKKGVRLKLGSLNA